VNYENDKEWHLWNQEAKRRIMKYGLDERNSITIEIQKVEAQVVATPQRATMKVVLL
jgi:hypothetical protein